MGLDRRWAEADDVTQGALKKALIHQRELIGKPVEAWLMRVAKNLWLDQIRRRRVRTQAIDPELWGNIHWLTPPADGEIRAQAREALKAFADLPAGQKEIAALVLVEGYSYQEAADVLQIPIGTVMSRLSRARLALAERLLGPARRSRAWPLFAEMVDEVRRRYPDGVRRRRAAGRPGAGGSGGSAGRPGARRTGQRFRAVRALISAR